MVQLAHTLGLHVIAEGVENDEQLAFLLSVACEYSQGYLFSRPQPGTLNGPTTYVVPETLPPQAQRVAG